MSKVLDLKLYDSLSTGKVLSIRSIRYTDNTFHIKTEFSLRTLIISNVITNQQLFDSGRFEWVVC